MIALILALAASTAQASQISLPRPFATPGSAATLPLLFLSQADSVSDVQFDLEYDPAAISLSAIVGEAARTAGKTLCSSDVAPNRKRFLLAGLNQAPLSDGPLLTLLVNLAPDAANGVYTLQLSDVMAARADARSLLPDSVDGAITVFRSLGPPVPLQAAGVLNAASLLPGPIAPGEMIRLVGSVIQPGLLFDGSPSQILGVAPNQIDAIVPPTLAGTMTVLQVTSSGQPIVEVLLSVASSAPALFTLHGGGAGQGTILNEDLTLNSASNPAARGTIVTLRATGLGQPGGMLSVQIGGLDSRVLYTETPLELSPGVTLVKCIVPAQASPGYTVPVLLTTGQAGSQTGVTIAIE